MTRNTAHRNDRKKQASTLKEKRAVKKAKRAAKTVSAVPSTDR
ncbi:hypothetical protein [Virgisporangium aliadipatigenens]|nr:hypothetical protein [Virgisporangium aliadipatigenens]